MKNLAKTDLAKAIVFDSLFNEILDEKNRSLGSPTQFDKIDYSAGIVNKKGESTITINCLKIEGVLYAFFGKYDCCLHRIFWKSCLVTRPFNTPIFVSCFNFRFRGLWDLEEEGDAAGARDTDLVEAVSACDNAKI